MGEGLLFGLSWLDGLVSTVLSERKVVKVSSILRCLSNHVEVNFLFCKCLVLFVVSSGIIRLLDFLIFFGYYREYCLFCGEGSFFFFCSPLFCKRCVFIHLLHLFLVLFTFGVLGP
jgi:hypothetical protein